jgi:hypothetical protein
MTSTNRSEGQGGEGPFGAPFHFGGTGPRKM